MERERTQPQHSQHSGSGGSPGGDSSLEGVRATLGGMLDIVDRTLDSIRPVEAEEYLQQNRQNGGQ